MIIWIDEDWKQILEKYQVDWTLIPEESILAKTLIEHTGWEPLYQDETAIILKKGQ